MDRRCKVGDQDKSGSGSTAVTSGTTLEAPPPNVNRPLRSIELAGEAADSLDAGTRQSCTYWGKKVIAKLARIISSSVLETMATEPRTASSVTNSSSVISISSAFNSATIRCRSNQKSN